MKTVSWKEVAEGVGVLSIVAGLALVAWEVRQANHIARTEVIITTLQQWNEFNLSRFENPDVAQLSLIAMNPEQYEITPLVRSRFSGMAWHFVNIAWTSQMAYDAGLLQERDLLNARADLKWSLDFMPGLTPEFLAIFDQIPYMEGVFVFEPLAEAAAKRNLPEDKSPPPQGEPTKDSPEVDQ
jgi:hypothetical protein